MANRFQYTDKMYKFLNAKAARGDSATIIEFMKRDDVDLTKQILSVNTLSYLLTKVSESVINEPYFVIDIQRSMNERHARYGDNAFKYSDRQLEAVVGYYVEQIARYYVAVQ